MSRAYAVLALAVIGLSFAAPLIRLSTAHPIAIAAWRLAISLAILLPLALKSGAGTEWRVMSRGDVLACTIAGIALAAHFWAWNASVAFTTIAASVVLVNVQPVFVAAGSAIWLKEIPSLRQWLGIAVAVVGAAVIVGDDVGRAFPVGRRVLFGDALALVGALLAAAYYLTGRHQRRRLGLLSYVTLVYGSCFATLILLAMALRVPMWPMPAREWSIFIALALGPMLLGHTGMNWALAVLPAYVVNLTVLGEPVGATLLAIVLPGIGEVPTALTVLGGALILAGVLVTLPRRKSGSGEAATAALP